MRNVTSATVVKYMEAVREFLENDKYHDFPKFLVSNKEISREKKEFWIEFIKMHGTEQEYKKFMEKVFPFEALGSEEGEKLKSKVAEMALKVYYGEAGIIDIFEGITPDFKKYIYMVQQLKIKYNMVPSKVLMYNKMYYNANKNIRTSTSFTMEYINLTDEEKKLLRQILKEKNLPLNDISYKEAHRYATSHQLIGIQNNKKNSSR